MGDCPTLANEASISSCVRFFDRRKDTFCSKGAVETDGSWRTAYCQSAVIQQSCDGTTHM